VREQYSIHLAIAAGLLILLVTTFFAFIQSPELLEFPESPVVRSASAIPHPVDGRLNCSLCHGIKGVQPYPVKHAGWSIGSCMKCHVPVSATRPETVVPTVTDDEKPKMAQPLPHPLKGMENCNGCHGLNGVHPYPEDHSGRTDDSCTGCHPFFENTGVNPH